MVMMQYTDWSCSISTIIFLLASMSGQIYASGKGVEIQVLKLDRLLYVSICGWPQ